MSGMGRRMAVLGVMGWMSVAVALAEGPRTLVVGPPGGKPAADFATIQEAVTAAPEGGAVIRVRPGRYEEVVHIDKPGIELRGEAKDAAQVVIAYANGAANTCGTGCSATVFVTGDGFRAENLTIANEWSKTGKPRTQAVALSITADKAVLTNVRLLGAQDTLYANSKSCKPDAGPCQTSRQFFKNCYIEGEVDFIFGNAKAVFEGCEIHSIAHDAGGYLTAQSRVSAEQDSGYVFDHCRVTADAGVTGVFLGRPWRDYATVIFLHTEMAGDIDPAGWSEWHKGETDKLKTTTYAEFHSTGPGGGAAGRDPHAKQLTAVEAERYGTKVWLAGKDGWDPEAVQGKGKS